MTFEELGGHHTGYSAARECLRGETDVGASETFPHLKLAAYGRSERSPPCRRIKFRGQVALGNALGHAGRALTCPILAKRCRYSGSRGRGHGRERQNEMAAHR